MNLTKKESCPQARSLLFVYRKKNCGIIRNKMLLKYVLEMRGDIYEKY